MVQRVLQLSCAELEVWKVQVQKSCLCHPPVFSDTEVTPWSCDNAGNQTRPSPQGCFAPHQTPTSLVSLAALEWDDLPGLGYLPRPFGLLLLYHTVYV